MDTSRARAVRKKKKGLGLSSPLKKGSFKQLELFFLEGVTITMSLILKNPTTNSSWTLTLASLVGLLL